METDFLEEYIKAFAPHSTPIKLRANYFKSKLKEIESKLQTIPNRQIYIEPAFTPIDFSENVAQEIVRRCSLPASYILYRKCADFLPKKISSQPKRQLETLPLSALPKIKSRTNRSISRVSNPKTVKTKWLLQKSMAFQESIGAQFDSICKQCQTFDQYGAEFAKPTFIQAKKSEDISNLELQEDELESYRQQLADGKRTIIISQIERDRLSNLIEKRRLEMRRDR